MQGQVAITDALSAKAEKAFLFDDLQTGSLISIGQLCDDDCVAICSRYNVDILKHNKIIIRGKRSDNDLWEIPIGSKPPSHPPERTLQKPRHTANGIIRRNKTKSELAAYYAASCFNPRPSTLIRAARLNYLASWPGLLAPLFSKHLPKSIASFKGHMDQEKKNLQSTQVLASDAEDIPTQEPDNKKTNHITCALVPNETVLSKAYSDQTGKFPVQSSRGNQYIFILYHYDTNSIHAVPIQNRQAASITKAWLSTFALLQKHGETIDLHILDNECSDDLVKAFTKNDIRYQKVSPHIHRRNAAERAIRTFKNHLLAGLCTCDPKFPIDEWDCLIPQAIFTLNLMRSSR